MPHIHLKPGQHDVTASAIIIRTDLGEPKVFLHKHLLSGLWVQPGGHVELNESPWSAALHEITEESGYVPQQLKLLQPQIRIKSLGADATLQPQPLCIMSYELSAHKNHFHDDVVYVFTANDDPKEKLSSEESETVGHFSQEEIIALAAQEIPDNVRRVALFAIDECLSNWEMVNLEHYQFND